MARQHHTPRLAATEEGVILLFCLIDDAYAQLNPRGRRHESLKRLSYSEVLTLALLQQLRGTESQRSFLGDTERFFSHLFPGVVGLAPPSEARYRRGGSAAYLNLLDLLGGDPGYLLDHGAAYVGGATLSMERALALPSLLPLLLLLTASVLGHAFSFPFPWTTLLAR